MIKLDSPSVPKPKPPAPSNTSTSTSTAKPASTPTASPIGVENSPSASRASQSRALGSPDAPPATTLLTENTQDASRNCLDAAGDWLALATPQIRARSEVLILKDTRPGPEGTTGHVVIRQGDTIFDPSSGQTYPSFNAFNAQGNYQIAHTVTGGAMNKILSTPPGSPERQAAIDAAKIPESVQGMLLADNTLPDDAGGGAAVTVPAGTPTTTLPGDPPGVVRVEVSKLPDPLRSQLQAANAITVNTGAGSGVSFAQQDGALYVAVNANRQLVDVQNNAATVFRTDTTNVLSVFAHTDMADPAQVRSAYSAALALTQGQQSLQPLPTNDPLTADQVAAYQDLGYTVAVLDPQTGLAAVRPPGAPGAQDISNIGAVPGGSPVYVLVGGPPLSTFGNLTPQQLADIHNGVATLPAPPNARDVGNLVDGQDAFWNGDDQNPAAVSALAAFMAERYAPPPGANDAGYSELDVAMYALQEATGPFSPQTSAALAAESLNPALAARGAMAGDVATWALSTATTPEATQAVLDAIGPQNMSRFVAGLQLSGIDLNNPQSMNDPAFYGSGVRRDALTDFLGRVDALPATSGAPNVGQAAFVIACAQNAGPFQLDDRGFREALGQGLGTVMALGDPAKAASESARLGALLRTDSVGELLSALPPEQRSQLLVTMAATPTLTADLIAKNNGYVVSALVNGQLQELTNQITTGFGPDGSVPLDQNGMPLITPDSPVPLPSEAVLQNHPEISALGQPLTAGTLAVAIQQGQVTPQQASAYLHELASEARRLSDPALTNPGRDDPDFFTRLGSNAAAIAIDVFNGGNPIVKSGLADYGAIDADALDQLADQVGAITNPTEADCAYIASAVAAGGAEHQAFWRGLPAFGATIAEMGNQVQGRRELAITGLSIAASMLLPVAVVGLVPEGATLTVAGVSLSGRALALAGANGALSTILNAAGQYDQTGNVQVGNALAGGAADALATYFGMQVLEKAGRAGGLTARALVQSSAYFAAGGVGSYVLGTPGALEGMLNGDPKYWEGAAKAAGLSFATSMVTTAIMAALPYPTREELPARNAQIEAEVTNMGFGPETPQAQALAEMQRLGISPTDVWQGSHVVLEDGGALYEQWSASPEATSRSGSSSHYPDVSTEQFQIRFGDSALLFGKDAAGNTWFQMEGHAIGAGVAGAAANPPDTAAHLWDYLVYKVRGQNVGPLGLSPWTESNPLVITQGQ